MTKIIDLTSATTATGGFVPLYQDGVTKKIDAALLVGGGATTASSVSFSPTGNVSSTNVQAAIAEVDSEKEPTITVGSNTQYWRGDKSWRDFFTDVRAAVLTGLNTATNAAIADTDTMLVAMGKLQAQITDLSTGQLASFKNKIINGNFNIWRRGTSFTTGNIYTADRWAAAGALGQTVTKVSDHPINGTSGSCLEITNTSGAQWVYQRIESNNLSDLVGKTVTASCYVKNIVAGGGASLQLVNANATDDWSVGTTIGTSSATSSSSWVKLTHSFTMTAAMANGLMVRIITSGGAGGASQVRVAAVQLEVGSIATAFETRLYTIEHILCQRYLPEISGGNTTVVGMGSVRSATQVYVVCHFPVEARVKPTGVTVTAATMLTCETAAASLISSAIAAAGAQGTKSSILSLTVSGGTAGQSGPVYFNGNAGSSGSILFTGCEL